MATTVVPPSVGAAAPSGGSSDTLSMISADLGIGQGSSDAAGSAPPAEAAIDPAIADEINAVPDGEPQIAADQVDEPAAEAQAAPEDGERPEIPNLTESRWKTVHAGYKWAQEVGKALGIVGEDGRVDVSLFPPVQELQAMRSSYSDRIAMEHDFSSGDPQNASNWIEQWNTFSPQGMTAVAATLPQVLAAQNPAAYQQLASPVLSTFLDFMYQQGATVEDATVRDYILNGARAAEWWLNGGPNGGTYRQDPDIFRPAAATPSAVERRLADSERRLQQIQRQTSDAQWGGFVRTVNTQIGEQTNAAVEEALKPLQAAYRNPVGYAAIKNEFTNRFRQQLKADGVGQRQFDVAVERAKRTQAKEDGDALVSHYMTMVRRAMNAVRGKFLTEASQGVKQDSDARHAQLQTSASKVGPTSGGAPRPQSIMPTLTREKGETANELQRRLIERDLGLAKGA